jgi:DNA-directed RNA polymerase subunit alpha
MKMNVLYATEPARCTDTTDVDERGRDDGQIGQVLNATRSRSREVNAMRIRWRGLELPTRVLRDEVASKEDYGRFTIEPFERGFGTTVGNSLRRILLSSLQGAAVTDVRIKGVEHEFSSLTGVLEDVTEIILNVKSLVVKSTSDAPKTLRVSVKGKPGETVEVRAADLESDASVEIVNRDQLLATLTDDVEFEMEMTVALGRSYVTAEENKNPDEEEQVIGVIPVDSTFSPVTRVRYRVEDTRVGQRTNYDRLVMEIWTNGTVTPEMALVEAAKILRKHLNPFVKYFEMGVGLAVEGARADSGAFGAKSGQSVDQAKLSMPISALNLSVRSGNCLTAANINTIGELLAQDESALLKLRSFGKTSMREVKRKLADYGLSLQPSEDGTESESDADHSDSGSMDAEEGGSPSSGSRRLAPLDSGTMIRSSSESSSPSQNTNENEVEIANKNGAQ